MLKYYYRWQSSGDNAIIQLGVCRWDQPFLFTAYPKQELTNLTQWLNFMARNDGEIFNEYDIKVEFVDFSKMIWKDKELKYKPGKGEYLDDLGYRFR